MVLLFYTTFISIDLAHHETFYAKVGKGGINDSKLSHQRPDLIEVMVKWDNRGTKAKF